MEQKEIVVVGGSAAGLTAAITARRFYPHKSILMIRKEEKVLIPCGIPYIYGTVGTPDKNLIPDAALEKNNIELLLDEVKDIDKGQKTIHLASGDQVGYEKLILATGSEPVVPPIAGVDKENVFAVWKDVSYLNNLLDKVNQARNIVIIGGGFIGMEFADECRKNREVNITVVEMLPHCLMLVFEQELCRKAEEIVRSSGVKVLTGEKVEAITGQDRAEGVKLASGQVIDADMVLIGIGAKANVGLAQKAGIKISAAGTIEVDRYMQTKTSDIFAAGDCCQKLSFFTQKPSNLMLASVATYEARIAGANLYKKHRVNQGVIGAFSTVIGDTAFARAGLSVKEAEENGYEVVVGSAEGPNRHPGCMPGGSNLQVNLVFEKGTRKIIGGQVNGAKSGGELINLVSACISTGMIADDISTFQMGTHPALTASPVAYQMSNAAEMAVKQLNL
ncbi:MAG: FAD-dependent oxidoreductase [Actinomycetota bacterium]|nr:FAD-dependent oxidoreductase [Actinomycetota bacterium]